jgi:DNA-binding NtrC family response regulator/class 3 adenylate cyclase
MARARPSSPPDPLDRLVGVAPALRTLRTQIRHLARFDAVGQAAVPTVLLQGETGTGKGLVARVIHDSGPRAQGPFIEVNCAAIPDALLEAELFGVEAGAFTDAKRAKPGLFEAASGGTLFLDEIAALPMALQGKLLTAIEAKRVRRLGAVVEHAVDVKLIVATQVGLSGHVQTGHFRADLYHRLAVVVLELPPLRKRGEDILVLARAFLQQYAAAYGVSPQRLSQAAEAWLLAYRWPGNVRELSHLLERVVLLEAATVIDPESLARRCLPSPGPTVPVDSMPTPRPDAPLNEPERLTDALRQSGGNLARAARLLGMSRGGLRYRLQKYGLGRLPQHDSSALAGEGAYTPILVLPHQVGEETSSQIIPPQDASTAADGPATSWEPKPVTVLAIAATWPDMTEADALRYEPWTVASRWQQTVAEKVAGFGGIVLQDSLALCLVAFGLPQTLEQLPQRAVQAALAIHHLATEAQTSAGGASGPIVRLAGHLGTLLVAQGTGELPGRWLAVGETLALTVRLLGHAAPGEVLVSAPIARLTQDWVEVHARPLPSGNEPADQIVAYRVGGLLPPRALQAGIGTQALRPFLGRARELAALHAMLTQVKGGQGQVVGILGEPGMGKSRLLAEWRQSLTAQEVTYLEGHCWSFGSATPYRPILDLLRAHCRITPDDSVESITAKVRGQLQGTEMTPDEWASYVLRLLEIQTGTEELAGVSPETLKAKTFEALRRICMHQSQQHPLILVVEDLQWIDPTSEAFLARLVDSIAGASILVLATYRPGYRPSWLEKSYATQLTLQPLSSQESVHVIHTVLQTEAVPNAMAQAILAKAQGNPFFLEEIAQTLVEQGMLGRAGGEALPPAMQLPPTLQGVLAARIDRLPTEPKALLQVAAVIGKTCTRDLLQRVADLPDITFLHQLSHLQRAEFLYEQPAFPAPVYAFKHVLIQEVAYGLLPQARKQTVHESTAQAIEALAGDRLAEWHGELAHHYSCSGNTQQAMVYLQRAGQQAADRSAYQEAITNLTRGLELLPNLPDTPERSRHELDLQITLGQVFTATKGQASPEVEHAFTRAHALCEQVGETAQRVAVLRGLRVIYVARGPLSKARELLRRPA